MISLITLVLCRLILISATKQVNYRVSQKSVYAFSNLNILTILNAIGLNFLHIVEGTFICLHIQLQQNRPSDIWEMNYFFWTVKKQKRALEIQGPIDCSSCIQLYYFFLHKDMRICCICMHNFMKIPPWIKELTNECKDRYLMTIHQH